MPHPLRTDVRGGSAAAQLGRRWVRTTVITILAAFATILSPIAGAAHAASAPADFAGLGDWNWPTTSEARQLGSDGVKTVRANVAWDWVEHTQGQRRWGGVDGLMKDAATNGYDLLLVLNGCVAWSCGETRVAPQTDQQRAQWLNYVADAARRYGAGGSYWAAHPELSRISVHWQIWNEVNVGADWPNPTAGGYAALLAAASQTIKGVDPSAKIVAAGLAEFPAVASGQTLAQFLTGLEQDPSFKSSADVVAVHGYASDAAGTARILDTARHIMRAAGDSRPLWITELGWASGGPAHRFVRDAAGQAAELRSAYDLLVGCRARWNLERAYWFSLSDVAPEALGEADYWGMHTGLYDAAGQPKPALDAFREYTGSKELPGGRGADCPLPGGNASDGTAATVKAPTVTIVQAPKYVGKTTKGKVDFTTSMGNSGHAECSLNDGAWTVCSTPYVIPSSLAEGNYTLQVRAVDDRGLASTTPAAASWTVDLTAPKTVFEKRPPKRSRSRAVTVRLGVAGGGSRLGTQGEDAITFQCQLNRGKWKACKARQRVTTPRAGKQLLRIRAVDAAGNVDPRGAQARYTVTRRR